MDCKTFSIFALAVFGAVIVHTDALNRPQEISIREKIRAMITTQFRSGERSQANNYRLIAGLVRLAFHDCVGKRCDGCINMNNPENKGLDVYINQTEVLYQKLKVNGKKMLSRADFWALCGIVAVEFASEIGQCPRCAKEKPKLKFQTGRKDCVGKPKGSPWTRDFHKFPSAIGTTEDTVDFFKKQFGFSEMDTVAILGAHSLGQAHRDASGFAHPWVERRDRFNNDYYKDMMSSSKEWKHVRIGRRFPKWQWESTKNGRTTMMLNCDMSLLKNLTKVSSVGQVKGCTYKTCKPVSTKVYNTGVWVKKFAKDNKLFMQKFGVAFQKMIRHGYTKLNNVEPWIGFG